jgi:hypothetical protein
MNNFGINLYTGINSGVDSAGNFSQNYLNYMSAQQLYYRSYISSSLMLSASYCDDNYQSTAASGTLDAEIRTFPTASNSQITTISIPRLSFGENIGKKTFNLYDSSSVYNIVDDGNGNLIDTLNSNVHVGNILYAQGMVILTNPAYNPLPTPPVPLNTFYVNKVSNTYGSISTGSLSVFGQNYSYSKSMSSYSTGMNVSSSTYDGDYSVYFTGIDKTSAEALLLVVFANDYAYPHSPYAVTSKNSITSAVASIGVNNNGFGNSVIEFVAVPAMTSSGLFVNFNKFNSNMDTTGTFTIKDSAYNVVFSKTVGQIISDNTYSYIATTVDSQFYLSFNNIQLLSGQTGSVSLVSSTSIIPYTTSGYASYQTGSLSSVLINMNTSYPYVRNINIQAMW